MILKCIMIKVGALVFFAPFFISLAKIWYQFRSVEGYLFYIWYSSAGSEHFYEENIGFCCVAIFF